MPVNQHAVVMSVLAGDRTRYALGMIKTKQLFRITAVLLTLGISAPPARILAAPAAPAAVSGERLLSANAEPGQWLSVGRTYDEQRFSPLTQVNTDTVGKLGLAWFADLDSNRGQEGTPLEIDGVLYISTAWSKVKAYEARTGRVIWQFDPKVPAEFAGRGCCDVVNRGLAAWNGKIYVASYDGRLIALDARTGAVVWSVLTVDQSKPYTSTGAPRGSEGQGAHRPGWRRVGVRGYISAYDAESGKLDWRFYTVPGNPAEGFEAPILKKAATTWHGKWWRAGGGGTVWDSMALRCRAQPVVCRRRQRLALEPGLPQSRRWG